MQVPEAELRRRGYYTPGKFPCQPKAVWEELKKSLSPDSFLPKDEDYEIFSLLHLTLVDLCLRSIKSLPTREQSLKMAEENSHYWDERAPSDVTTEARHIVQVQGIHQDAIEVPLQERDVPEAVKVIEKKVRATNKYEPNFITPDMAQNQNLGTIRAMEDLGALIDRSRRNLLRHPWLEEDGYVAEMEQVGMEDLSRWHVMMAETEQVGMAEQLQRHATTAETEQVGTEDGS